MASITAPRWLEKRSEDIPATHGRYWRHRGTGPLTANVKTLLKIGRPLYAGRPVSVARKSAKIDLPNWGT
jgi:hypothetical protein